MDLPLFQETQPMLSQLNSKQQEAVQYTEGPLLIIAGAGSGKTRTLTFRIAHLIKTCGIDPFHILAVTFTNKAAGEMKERVESLLGQKIQTKGFVPDISESPLISTFHSFGVRLLRAEGSHIGIDPKFSIFDSSDQKAAIKKAAQEAEIDLERFKPNSIQWAISAAKNQGFHPDDFAKTTGGDQLLTQAAKVFPIYQKSLKSQNALDFDDLLLQTVHLFKSKPEILTKYQDRFQFILVDEYQDTNPVQYELITLLAKKYQNLCVVGDDDQSIYGWRGADIRNILDFEKDFPKAKIIKLEQNYRSTSHILDAAHAVISKNPQRKAKKLWTDLGEGNQISILEAFSGRDESAQIVREIENQVRESDSPLSDFAVLYRTNAQSRVLEEAFLNAGIPYHIVGGTRFYERKEIKDILAFLKILANPLDDTSLSRIINVPPRKIGAVTLDKLFAFSTFNSLPLLDSLSHLSEVGLSPAAEKNLTDFHTLLQNLKTQLADSTLTDFLKTLIKKTKYDTFLLAQGEEGESRLENIHELLSVTKRYDELQPESALQAFLEEVALITDLDTAADSGPSVTLMTLHSAKGLEFPTVFLTGLEEELFPHMMSFQDPKGIEEERRLCYVGITRAMTKLFLTHARERLIFGQLKIQRPSRFLSEIPSDHLDQSSLVSSGGSIFSSSFSNDPDSDVSYVSDDDFSLPDLEPGSRVIHPVFGPGVVTDVIGRVVSVDFGARRGTKKILAEKLKPA